MLYIQVVTGVSCTVVYTGYNICTVFIQLVFEFRMNSAMMQLCLRLEPVLTDKPVQIEIHIFVAEVASSRLSSRFSSFLHNILSCILFVLVSSMIFSHLFITVALLKMLIQ